MKEILDGFKTFILRGNLIDLAVAIVIGLAFVAVVNSLVTNLITPIIALIFGESSLRSMTFDINDAVFAYGAFVDDVIRFVAVAAAVYFFVVVLTTRSGSGRSAVKPKLDPARGSARSASALYRSRPAAALIAPSPSPQQRDEDNVAPNAGVPPGTTSRQD